MLGGFLIGIIESFLHLTSPSAAGAPRDERLLDQVIERVRELNGGDMDDDLAALALGASPWTRDE